jgi:hypothetical protein
MRILLIATNQADRYMDRMAVRPLPVGLAYVAAYISPTRHQLHVLDLMFSDDARTDTLAAVQRFQPDVIGLSLRNLDNQSYLHTIWHLPTVRHLIGQIRSVSNALIVCGGPAFSILPAACFTYLSPDLGIAGDAAASFAQLVDCLDSREAFHHLPGLVYRNNGHVVVSNGHMSMDFQRPPRLDLLDIRRYDKAGFGIGVVNKLAPYYYPTTHIDQQTSNSGWRMRAVDDVVEELRQLQRDFGIRKIFFIDSGFNTPLQHAKELCQGLIRAGLGLRWNSYLRPGECDAELVQLMRRSGCSLALINAIFADPETGKDTQEQMEPARCLTTLCTQGDLPFTLTVSFGDAGETRATVKHKLEALRATRPAFATLRTATRILPHTLLAHTALQEGCIRSPADLIRPTFYLTAAVRDWLLPYLRAEAAAQPRWHLM